MAGMLAGEGIIQSVVAHLGSVAKHSGTVPYNGWNTLRPGPLYIMGLNPGGDPQRHQSIPASLNSVPEEHCAYKDECWGHPRVYGPGQSPHQKRVCDLVSLLGVDISTVFSANAIFVRSKGRASLGDSSSLWEKCWPVHQFFLGVVRPRIVLCLGNGRSLSAFGLVRSKCVGKISNESSDQRSFRDGKWFDGSLPLNNGSMRSVHVVGAPHPSRFGITATGLPSRSTTRW